MSSFSRTFLRTSRNALKYQRGVNPVQQAWGAQGKYGVRNYAAAFQRDKPHVNIGMFPCAAYYCHLLIENRNHWSRRSRKGTIVRLPPTMTPSNILSRLPSQQPSPSVKQKRATPSSSNTVPLTRLPRSGNVVLPSPQHTSSTRPTTGIMPTLTARVTPITLKT